MPHPLPKAIVRNRSVAPLMAILAFPLLTASAEDDHGDNHGPQALEEHDSDHGPMHSEKDAPDFEAESNKIELLTGIPIDFGEGPGVGANIGGIFFPELFVQSVFGDSTSDPAKLAIGDHDPQTQATLQSLHFALDMEVGDLFSGFVNVDVTTDADGELDGQLEEGFLHVKALPWLSVGGGQFLNSFGFHNERHVHAWDFVDQYLVSGRMLNEGELTTQGGELILQLPTSWESTLTLGGGGVRNHGGHEDVHGAGEEEPAFEPDGANFDAWLVSGNYRADYGAHENMAGTVSGAVGENGFGKITQVYGVGHEIIWNRTHALYDDAKNTIIGKYRGGSFGTGSLAWRTELMYRNIEAVGSDHHDTEEGERGREEEHGPRSATLDEFGFYSQLKYGVTDLTTASMRSEWVSGIDGLGLDQRWRVSPAISIYLNAARNLHLRLQYNYDHGEDFGDDHSVWLQLGFAWGAPASHGHHRH